ncbi:hypothetical protein [Halopiger aswanensis]|uniref:hypothetical protein n=1 Tax=Halopiger aswanensis TaxID=148449 RepID=UPI000E745395|nr:hypothetical protein [Halopiger aswanensis]
MTDWTVIDWLNTAIAAGPIIAGRVLRQTRLARLRPRARRLLARVFVVALVYCVVGELAAATGITAFVIELGRLLLTRRQS